MHRSLLHRTLILLGVAFLAAMCAESRFDDTPVAAVSDVGADPDDATTDIPTDTHELEVSDTQSEVVPTDAPEEPEDPARADAARDAIITEAATSSCRSYVWEDRGKAAMGYVKGVSLVFARAVCNQSRSDVLLVSRANTGDDEHDALSWYDTTFADLGMDNEEAGVDTLRHAYTLLLGLGMGESTGRHCCGRDMAADNTTADTAEAGAWQTSWNSHVLSKELPVLFDHYVADASGCLLDVFKEGVSCTESEWESFGTGDGFDFQELEKSCPAFAAEYAAVMLRVSGGSSGHYGILRKKVAEVRPECDALFQRVQAMVEETPSVCRIL